MAASTAGLLFATELLNRLEKETAGVASVALHVSQDTFAPVRSAHVEEYGLQGEQAEVSPQFTQAIQSARALGGRIVSVGTTSTRTLEWAARQGQCESPRCNLTLAWLICKSILALSSKSWMPS